MSRMEFMRQLERLLKDVSEEERKEALSYYQSYFEDAGVENEARILKELESPEKVAATIKTDLGMETEAGAIKADLGMETEAGVFTEHGFEDSRFEQKHPISIRKETSGQQADPGASQAQYDGAGSYRNHEDSGQKQFGSGGQSNEGGGQSQFGGSRNYEEGGQSQFGSSGRNHGDNSQSQFHSSGRSQNGDAYDYDDQPGFNYNYQKTSGYGDSSSNSGDGRSTYSGRSGMELLLIIAIAVITSPIWLGAVTGIGGTVFGLAVSVVCIAGAFYIAGGVLFGVGIGQFIIGKLAVGFALTGTGLLLLALAILATILCVWVCGKLVPWLCRVIGKLWRSIFSGKEQRA
ncbi:MAG: DUF1700 domain-containing protein [Lachnospiraceae bacterium]|nr:DUF1700 domain-containing protein [Lachnospiraceae bacterium]